MSMQEQIRQALQVLDAEYLQIDDESHMHSRGLESHFKAVVVSRQFDGLNAVRRHQKVYAALAQLMPQFHALALHTYSPQEWQQLGVAPQSPACRGGSRHDQ